MNLNDLTESERAEMERFIAKNLESNLNDRKFDIAKINLEFYTDHIKSYGSENIKRYCDLRNRYNHLRFGRTK